MYDVVTGGAFLADFLFSDELRPLGMVVRFRDSYTLEPIDLFDDCIVVRGNPRPIQDYLDEMPVFSGPPRVLGRLAQVPYRPMRTVSGGRKHYF